MSTLSPQLSPRLSPQLSRLLALAILAGVTAGTVNLGVLPLLDRWETAQEPGRRRRQLARPPDRHGRAHPRP